MKVIGILNITPNASSDAGFFATEDRAVTRAKQMVEQGVSIIDVGAESINQYVDRITFEEEHARLKDVLPKVIKIAKSAGILVSIDTYKPETAEICVGMGVHIINDMRGLRDERMVDLVNNSEAMIIASHSVTVPSRFAINIPAAQDAVAVISSWMRKTAKLVKDPTKLILDPGIGFGKNAKQDWDIIRRISVLVDTAHGLGAKFCLAHSRKSFMGSVDRESGTLAISALVCRDKVDFVRIHNTLLHKWFFDQLVVAEEL